MHLRYHRPYREIRISVGNRSITICFRCQHGILQAQQFGSYPKVPSGNESKAQLLLARSRRRDRCRKTLCYLN